MKKLSLNKFFLFTLLWCVCYLLFAQISLAQQCGSENPCPEVARLSPAMIGSVPATADGSNVWAYAEEQDDTVFTASGNVSADEEVGDKITLGVGVAGTCTKVKVKTDGTGTGGFKLKVLYDAEDDGSYVQKYCAVVAAPVGDGWQEYELGASAFSVVAGSVIMVVLVSDYGWYMYYQSEHNGHLDNVTYATQCAATFEYTVTGLYGWGVAAYID